MAAWQGGGEFLEGLLDRGLLVGEVAERILGGGDEALHRGVVAGEFGGHQAEIVDDVREGDMSRSDSLVELGGVVDEGLEAAEGVRGLFAAATETLSAASDEQLDVLPGVGVEGGEEGVEVGIRFGLGEGEVGAVFDVALPEPGSISTIMSLRFVFGRNRRLALGWISSMYFGSMSIPTTAWPFSRSTEETLPIWMPAMSTA